jgi:uncharacterized membrane protein
VSLSRQISTSQVDLARPSSDRSEARVRPGILSWEVGGLILITLVGLALRLAFLGQKSLWLDEAVTLKKVLVEPAVILSYYDESHPPLYYLFMHFWVALGQSEVILRLPSAIFGTLALPVLYGLSRDWGGPRLAALATALLAVAPLHIWYSQEARMYSMVGWLALVATFCVVRAVRGRGRGYWIGAALAVLAAMYTDYSAIVWLLGGNMAFLILVRRHPQLRLHMRAWCLAHAVLLVAYLPWVPLLWQNVSWVLASIIPPQSHLIAAISFLSPEAEASAGVWGFALLLAGAVVAVLALALTWRHGASAVTWLEGRPWLGGALWAVFALSLIAMLIPRVYFIKRESLIWLPYLLIAVACVIARADKRRMLAIGGLALSLVVSLYTVLLLPKDNWRAAAALVQAQQAGGDVIVLQPDYEHYVFDYYYQGGIRRIGLSPGATDLDVKALGPEVKRVWLVQFTPPADMTADELAGRLDAIHALLLSREWYRVRVRLYGVQ